LWKVQGQRLFGQKFVKWVKKNLLNMDQSVCKKHQRR